MHIECMVMHDVQNESLVFLYQLGTLSPLPSGEKEVSQSERGGMNFHLILRSCRNSLTEKSSCNFLINSALGEKYLPLSLTNIDGHDLLAINCLSRCRKVTAVMSRANSR